MTLEFPISVDIITEIVKVLSPFQYQYVRLVRLLAGRFLLLGHARFITFMPWNVTGPIDTMCAGVIVGLACPLSHVVETI